MSPWRTRQREKHKEKERPKEKERNNPRKLGAKATVRLEASPILYGSADKGNVSGGRRECRYSGMANKPRCGWRRLWPTLRQPRFICLRTDSDTFTPSEVSFLSAFVWPLRQARKAKRTLCSTHQARVAIEVLFDGVGFSEALTRARFEEINGDSFKNTLDPVKQVVEDSGLKETEIDEIALVGGSTCTPKARQLTKNHQRQEPDRGINPDEEKEKEKDKKKDKYKEKEKNKDKEKEKHKEKTKEK